MFESPEIVTLVDPVPDFVVKKTLISHSTGDREKPVTKKTVL
jgi:hypothetical protein